MCLRASCDLLVPGFRPYGIASEGDLVDFDNLAMAKEFELPLFLQYHDTVGMQNNLMTRRRRADDNEKGGGQRGKYSGTCIARIIAERWTEEC